MKAKNKKLLARVKEKLADARNLINEVRQDEQDAYDSHGEKWQDSDAGGQAQENIYALEDMATYLEDWEDNITDMMEEK